MGLTNLGTTCYINSLFQQLFALPDFCGRLLSVPSATSEEEQKVSLLYQLQRIIVNLKFGFKKVAHFQQVGFKFNQWIDVGYWERVL